MKPGLSYDLVTNTSALQPSLMFFVIFTAITSWTNNDVKHSARGCSFIQLCNLNLTSYCDSKSLYQHQPYKSWEGGVHVLIISREERKYFHFRISSSVALASLKPWPSVSVWRTDQTSLPSSISSSWSGQARSPWRTPTFSSTTSCRWHSTTHKFGA